MPFALRNGLFSSLCIINIGEQLHRGDKSGLDQASRWNAMH